MACFSQSQGRHQSREWLFSGIASAELWPSVLCRGVNFGADNWLVFKKVTVDQVTTGQTDSTTDILSNGNTEKKEEKTVLQGDDPLAVSGLILSGAFETSTISNFDDLHERFTSPQSMSLHHKSTTCNGTRSLSSVLPIRQFWRWIVTRRMLPFRISRTLTLERTAWLVSVGTSSWPLLFAKWSEVHLCYYPDSLLSS